MKNTLGNPAAIIAGGKILDKSLDVLPFVLKTAFVVGVTTIVISKFMNKFEALKTNNAYPNANISETQAALRADVIYKAVGVFSDKFNLIAQQIEGLNYNGFVKLYNAFGNRGGIFMIKDDKNLIDFLQSNLSNYEFNQLSFLLNGAFF